MTVHLTQHDNKGKAYVGDATAPRAEMTFSLANDHLLIIDHTEVIEDLRGRGVGRQLLEKIVAHAREHAIKIIPLCPYAKSVFDKDPSIRDVLRP